MTKQEMEAEASRKKLWTMRDLAIRGTQHYIKILQKAIEKKEEFVMDAPLQWDKKNVWRSLENSENTLVAKEIVFALKSIGFETAKVENQGIGIVSVPLSEKLIAKISDPNYYSNARASAFFNNMGKKYR